MNSMQTTKREGVPAVVIFSTGFLTPGAQSVHEASGVSGCHLTGLLLPLERTTHFMLNSLVPDNEQLTHPWTGEFPAGINDWPAQNRS